MIVVRSEVVDKGVHIRPAKVRHYIKMVLARHAVESARVTVIFTSDEAVRKLKKTYLHQDAYTDVLAFRLDDDEDPSSPAESHIMEGEIYISAGRAKENARDYGVSLSNELSRLIFHGCLHLLGYQDTTPSSQGKMRNMEDTFLKEVSPEDLLAP